VSIAKLLLAKTNASFFPAYFLVFSIYGTACIMQMKRLQCSAWWKPPIAICC